MFRLAGVRWHTPLLGGGGDEPGAGAGAGLLQILARAPHRPTATCAHALIDAIFPQAAVGRGVFGADLRPVALEFLSDDHRQGCEHTLPHLRLGHADSDCVIAANDQPGVDFLTTFDGWGPGFRSDVSRWRGAQRY